VPGEYEHYRSKNTIPSKTGPKKHNGDFPENGSYDLHYISLIYGDDLPKYNRTPQVVFSRKYQFVH
jgi:hypothetical protein